MTPPLRTCPTCAHLDAPTRTCKAIGAALTRWRDSWVTQQTEDT